MRVLVIGSGGREHALARALSRTAEVVVAPGNAGIAPPIRRAPLDDGVSGTAVVDLATRESIDLVVVGPEAPLCEGLVDALLSAGILTFGPSRAAARLEGSKAFLKRFAARHAIPTADFTIATSYEEAEAQIRARGAPVVVKADGLCAGKGVVVASTVDEALAAARAMLVERALGDAGATVVIEACLEGEEASVHVVTDGSRMVTLPVARDHKRIFDGDRGPNTGGMGVVAPSARVSPDLLARIEDTIVRPTLEGMRAEGCPFRGVLFAGIMITKAGEPMLLEHNVRFGDPECEALMSLLDGDVAAFLASAARGALDTNAIRVAEGRHAIVVVLAAAGYPAKPRTGDVVQGLARAEAMEGVVVHHSGTRLDAGRVVTGGGRVFAITATASSHAEARRRAYAAADAIAFEGKQLRYDIG